MAAVESLPTTTDNTRLWQERCEPFRFLMTPCPIALLQV
jgi:hypothetical protein